MSPVENKMQLLNELCYYVVSVLYLCFTDFNPNPEVKIYCGWFVVVVMLGNLIWPNFTMMWRGIWPDIKGIFVKDKKKRAKIRGHKKYELHRNMLIAAYDLQLKSKKLPELPEEQNEEAPIKKATRVKKKKAKKGFTPRNRSKENMMAKLAKLNSEDNNPQPNKN